MVFIQSVKIFTMILHNKSTTCGTRRLLHYIYNRIE